MVQYSYMKSPVGKLLLTGTEAGLKLISFPKGKQTCTPEANWQKGDNFLRAAIRQLDAYFAGRRKIFDLALDPEGTPFQLSVWQALRDIPYGETVSYGELARRIGHPRASRAVGAANGSNPLPIVIPCHRVIGASGKLTGYGGGLDTKKALLTLEQQQTPLPLT